MTVYISDTSYTEDYTIFSFSDEGNNVIAKCLVEARPPYSPVISVSLSSHFRVITS
jgi:hypothetical protein